MTPKHPANSPATPLQDSGSGPAQAPAKNVAQNVAQSTAAPRGAAENARLSTLADDLVRLAKTAGADYADVYAYSSTALSTAVRLGEQDYFEREEDTGLGLRVFIGKSSACLSSSDIRLQALKDLADKAVTMARHVPADEFAILPERGLAADAIPALNLTDPAGEPDAQSLIALALAVENAGRAVDGITNSEGAEAEWSSSTVVLCASNGFQGAYRKDYCSASLSLIAGEGTGMERDYAYDGCTRMSDMDKAAEIGQRAADRTLARMNPRRGKTGRFPVIYDRRVSSSLVGHLLGAINGARIVRGTSFLNDSLGKQIFTPHITIHDDAGLDYMPKSRPFDSEGQAITPLTLVESGVLNHWIMDLRSAARLAMPNNGHASRGLASQPSPSAANVWLENGEAALADIIADIKDGFYITELIGSSISTTSGDYSRGASGFWIENGKIAYPVSELTIAGNLRDIYASLIPADDLRRRYGTDAPSLFVPALTVASPTQ